MHEFQVGFGDFYGEFWIGLDLMHRLTNSGEFSLEIGMVGQDGAFKKATYGSFKVNEYSFFLGR